MSNQRDIDLIDGLISYGVETEWLEFKLNNDNPELISKYCSALSNSARLHGREQAYVIWGVDDKTHQIVGTTFSPKTKQVGGQGFEIWLSHQLSPRIAFEFREVMHPKGKLWLLEIPAATGTPTSASAVAYVRVGSATPKLTDEPERYRQLIGRLRPNSWETGHAAPYVTSEFILREIDYKSYFELTSQRQPETNDAIIEKLAADAIVTTDVGGRWNVTNLGAILFANDLNTFPSSLARKHIRFVAYQGKDRTTMVTHRQDGRKGYAAGFTGFLAYLNGLLPRNELIGQALRETHPLYPELAIRELVANALIHQDMTVSGAGPQIELFSDRIEITNPGAPLVEVNRMIDLPPRSRNEAIASLMRRMGICEEQGSGMDKVFREVELFQLPAPLLRASGHSMNVTLYSPRKFADMTAEERVRACYYHAVLQFLSGERLRNASLCERFGIALKNAAQASGVIKKTLEEDLIKVADEAHPRAGYVPWWA